MARVSRTDKLSQTARAIGGISKRLAPRQTYLVAGLSISGAGMVAVFQAHLDAAQAVDKLRAALAGAVRKERAAATKAKALGTRLKAWVLNEYDSDVEAIADFGWEAPKPRGAKTVAGKAAGARKRAAGRAARQRALAPLKAGKRGGG